MTEDVFMGLTSVKQFEAKLNTFKMKRSSVSQMSTAHNSTLKSRKSTLCEGLQVGFTLDSFVERVHFLATRCTEYADRNECARIAMELGLSLYRIQSIPKLQEREDFIIETLQKQVQEQLKLWKNKSQQRELSRTKVQVPEDENNQNIFNWVEIHTKFRSLKKKLKFALIEILNQKENCKKIYTQEKITNLEYPKPDMQSIIEELNHLLRKVKKTPQEQSQPNLWSNEKEKEFKEKRNSAKHRLGMLIHSNSFNTVGMGEYIIQHDKGQQDQQKREELLIKYDTSVAMTEDELLYLVNTSILLNKCSDKKLLQAVINQLDKDVVSDVELTIAENILSQYNKVSKDFNQSRLNYLKQNLQGKQKSFIAPKVQQNNSESLRKLQVKILKMLRDMKDSTLVTLKENTEKYRSYYLEYKKGNPIANPLVWKFKDIMMGILERKKREKREKKLATTNDSNKPIFPSKTENLTLKVVMRKTHPSSKVIMKSQPDLPSSKVQDYILKLKKINHERNRSNFSQFYSGGPVRQRPYAHSSLTIEESDTTLPYCNTWITPEIELAAANKIKKALKAYVSKKRFEKAVSQKKFIAPPPSKFYRLVQKLHEKRKNIDVEGCYKSLKLSFRQTQQRKKTIMKPKLDYSKVPIPKTMIQLKLKQRKLFLALKVNNTLWTEHSGFIFDITDVNCYDVDMYCPLYYAAKQESIAFCNFLLSNGADVNMPCQNGETPTFAAFSSGNIVIINLFISNGADIEKRNNDGKNPLCFCSINLLRELNLQYRVCMVN